MLISTKLSNLISKSHQDKFSRNGIASIKIDNTFKLDGACKKCNSTHNHGFLELSNSASFIMCLDGLDRLPTYDVLKRGLDELIKFEAQNNCIGCITWIGFYVESFTREDVILLKELVLFRNKTLSQIKVEKNNKERSIKLPSGLESLEGKQGKFFEELWDKT